MALAAKLQDDANVLYIDCRNMFDPHKLFRLTNSEESLNKVFVVRPFTLYQLRELVLKKLEYGIQKLNAKSLIISGLSAFKDDHRIDEEEMESINTRIFERIESLTRDYNLYTVVSWGGIHGSHC